MTTSSVLLPRKTETPWTILKLLRWTTSYFNSHQIEQPRATAEVLLAHALELNRIDLYLRYDQPLHQEELTRFKSLIKRRVKAEPVAYITGEKEFWSMPFIVTEAVLIPRPDTECLVETTLGIFRGIDSPSALTVLEVGTGSGAIAVALATERPFWRIYASDRSPEAIAVAKKNAERLSVSEKLCFFCCNWFSSIGTTIRFNLIVSNPPYIRHDALPHLQPEIFRYEPHGALDGGASGLDALDHIMTTAPQHLAPGGILALEIGHDQKTSVMEISRSIGLYEPVVFYKDYSGVDRVAVLRLNG
jgi:release factor glutamine methyltransferase